MFSSDYPHVEGGRNPKGRFSRSTADLPEPHHERFFRENPEGTLAPFISPQAA